MCHDVHIEATDTYKIPTTDEVIAKWAVEEEMELKEKAAKKAHFKKMRK